MAASDSVSERIARADGPVLGISTTNSADAGPTSVPPPQNIPRHIANGNDGERGVALIAVLWILVLLATLVLGFVANARTDLHIVRNNSEAARARAIADSGVTLAILGVFDTTGRNQWQADGRVHALAYGGGTLRIHIEDEDGKLDVNRASIDTIRALFQVLGAEDPDVIAGAISRQRNAAVEAAKRGGNLDAVAPPAFFALEELRALPGIADALYRRLDRVVTVYSNNPSVDMQTAPVEVLQSLPGAQQRQIGAVLAQRELAAATGDANAVTGTAQVGFAKALRVFTIVSGATSPSGARFTREATISLTGLPEAPIHFLAWRERHSDEPASAAANN